MPRVVSEPITKVTLNLYSRDLEYLKKRYPDGYSERIREILRQHIRAERAYKEVLRYGPLDFPHHGETDYE